MKTDSWKLSLIWGRVGATVMACAAFALNYFGYQVDPGDISTANASIAAIAENAESILIAGAGLLSIASKYREKKRSK